jgi:hypothetical protein
MSLQQIILNMFNKALFMMAANMIGFNHYIFEMIKMDDFQESLGSSCS